MKPDVTPTFVQTNPTATVAPQLSEQNFAQLAEARRAWRKIGRAVGVATFDGWTMGVFGALTFLMGMTSIPSILLGIGMCGVAFVELRGADGLKKLRPGVTGRLALNQLALAAMLTIYSLWCIWGQWHGAGPFAQEAATDPDVAVMLQQYEHITRLIPLVLYGGIILVATVGLGAMAWYYHTRGQLLRAYLERTPSWILKMQEAGITI